MPEQRLHRDVVEFLSRGLSIHVGASDADDWPQLGRALAVRALPGPRVSLLLSTRTAQPLLAAVPHAGRVAAVLCQPTTHRTLLLKGVEATVEPADPQDWPQLAQNRKAFTDEIEVFGFNEEFSAAWFDSAELSLSAVTFRPTGAWNQTPGPGAGAPVPLHE